MDQNYNPQQSQYQQPQQQQQSQQYQQSQYQQSQQYPYQQPPQQYQQQYQQGPVKLKGSSLLKVSSILMIIGGAIGIIVGIVRFVTMAGLGAIAAYSGASSVSAIFYVAGTFSIIGPIIQLIAGIMGVSNHNNKAKANSLLVLGIVVASLSVLGSILTVVSGGDFSILSLLLGLVLPVLYIVGAVQNKNS